MKPRARGLRQVVGTCTSTLIVTLSVALPVMERADLARETAFESQHDATSCAPGHDHTLCTQVGASHALPSRQDLRVGVTPAVGGALVGSTGSVFVPMLANGHPTRAPPSA